MGSDKQKILDSEAKSEDKNRTEIEKSIDKEIQKLQQGVKKLKQFNESNIGGSRLIDTKQAYEKQISDYESLKFQLGQETSNQERREPLSNVINSLENSLERKHDELIEIKAANVFGLDGAALDQPQHFQFFSCNVISID